MNNFTLKRILILVAIILFLVLELAFDIVEITIGKVLLITNSARPQIGRLWEEGQNSDVNTDSLAIELDNEQNRFNFTNVYELYAVLDIRNKLEFSRNSFLEFYKVIPKNQALKIVDPLTLLRLQQDEKWFAVLCAASNQHISFFFLDGNGQQLHDEYVDLQNITGNTNSTASFEKNQNIKGRIITKSQFMQAYLKLPRHYQIQILNDPYKLIQWGDSLNRVGISSLVKDTAVEIIFEIKQNEITFTQNAHSYEMAIGYLINELKKVDPPVFMEFPG